ncbi:MAG: GGDEF domain-containing protein, partial [Reyranella sp.]
LFVMCIAMVVRIVFSLLEEPPQEPTTPFYDPTQGITLLINTICVVAMTLGFLMMTHERLRHHFESLAKTDELTALPNRRFLLDEGKRLRAPACVLMIDLDYFSEVNRTYGHTGGDRALVAFANLARSELRPSDLVARYGGEEFCALLRDVDEPEARRIAERLRARIAELSIDVDGRPLRITASIGLARLDGDVETTIRKADSALYRAKALGRNQVQSAEAHS